MLNGILEMLFTVAVLAALGIALAKKNHSKLSNIIIGIAAAFSCVAGFILYGLAYSETTDNFMLTVVNTLCSTINMYLMDNNFSAIENTVLMQNEHVVVLFWCVHLMAIYTTGNAVLLTIGTPLLNRIRLLISKRRKNLIIIYDINKDSLMLGDELASDRKNALIFVNNGDVTATYKERIEDMKALFFHSNEANISTPKFLKSIGVNKRKNLMVYALSSRESDNFKYALKMLDGLKSLEIPPDKTGISMIENMEMPYGFALQNSPEKYGFGSVMVVDRAYITAHVLVKKYPPCNYIRFNEQEGKAEDGECFTAVIVGFGKIGQAVLKNLVINGQFENCGFRVVVFDPENEAVSGYVHHNNKYMMQKYDITFEAESARSRQFYQFIEENIKNLKYIALCTGDDNKNNEIATEIQSALERMEGNVDVFQCSYDEIVYENLDKNGKFVRRVTDLYTAENLDIKRADRKAMKLNHMYCSGISELDDWNKTGFIERMSSRASANFSGAFLKMVGLTEEDVIDGDGWERLTETQKENLSRTEHLRWCAFYYANGYREMPVEVFRERCRAYTEEKKQYGKSKIKIQKDISERMHICLKDWDELDELSEQYRRITGEMSKDYKQDDTNNVMMLPALLKK